MKASKKNPHILNIAPPLNMKPRWFKNHVAYTMAKYGMSMCVLGMSEEFKEYGIGVNALWPQTGKLTKRVQWVVLIFFKSLYLSTCSLDSFRILAF